MGRFINADALVATGQGLLGNNMFAYCNNSPVFMLDPFGESPFGPLGLADYYLLHKYVQLLCVAEFGWDMEVYVKGPLGTGRLDLYDYKTNTYYEVKTKTTVNNAKWLVDAQMTKYDHSQIAAQRYKDDNITDSPTKGTAYVSGSFSYGMYDVYYSTYENGLIIYEPEVNYNRALKTAVALVLSLGAAFGYVDVSAVFGAYTAVAA